MVVVSLASSAPVFHCTGSSLPRIPLCSARVCVNASQRRRKISGNPLRVAAPSSASSVAASDEDREDVGPSIEIEDSEEDSSSKFSWRDHWYPVSLVEDLDPRYPTPFQLLNRDLVLWFDSSASQWVAFDDKCPHRLAPLSEGRIDENGHLQCSYHGWSFDGCGSCSRIPQAASQGPEARAVKSPRACATRFPTMVSQGLLFVWPDEKGWERAQATIPPKLPDDFDKPEFSSVTIQRDLYYGYDTLMENVSDPSHIDFAHHKVTGRRDRAKPLPFKMESSGPWGFAGANDDNPKISSKFIAPCYFINKVEIDTKLPIVGDQKWVIWICSFNVPMAPGKTRSIVCSARNFFQLTMPGPAWWQVVPRWHEHWTSNKVYDGDMIVLQGQEKVFLSQSSNNDVNKQYTKLTFTPTQADRFVLAFRNWLSRHGNSQPQWFGTTGANQTLPSTVLSKRQMMDRYEQHTLKCSSCKNAHNMFEKLQKVLIGAAVISTATTGIPSDFQLRIIIGAIAILAAASAYALNELSKNFVFIDYVHADID
ncbi:pheophorbide a oxygenase [Salvia divinorum]|uniref:Pheophorbide a oxygenase n=1 Tax=Salvia divinorum TaxID=28513 RepID=A0ABD1HMS1_SALDI